VVVEPWTLPDPGWARALIEEHGRSAADTVIGGPVLYDGPDEAYSWAEFFFEYGAFLPPFGGEVDELAVNNVSYSAELLRRMRPFWEEGFWKHFLHRELRARGVRFLAAPLAVVRHSRPVAFSRVLPDPFHHGRGYAARRGGPAARALLAPFLPVVLTARLARQVRGKTGMGGTLRRAFPALLLAYGAWALGEALGHLAGDGGSSARVF